MNQLIILALVFLIGYLILKRIREKKEENFEDRNN